MRTTVDINDDLLRRVRERAARQGVTLREIFERALNLYLRKRRRPVSGYRLEWRTDRGRVLPGVKLDDRDALHDLMDGRR
jgi:hypothetical protein